MRISTADIYLTQTNSMLNDQAAITTAASELSSGISLNKPSDDPLEVGHAIALSNSITQENTDGTIAQIASNQLSTTDGALSQLTDILQQAITLAVRGASDTVSPSDKSKIGDQVNQLLGETIGIANTQYAGKYIFGGTSALQQGPVIAIGNPPTGVQLTGNNQVITQDFSNGQTLQLSTSLEEAFNTRAADGSPSTFQALINLRDALQGGAIAAVSEHAINQPGALIGLATQLSSAAFSTPLTADSNGDYAIKLVGPSGTATMSFAPTDTISTMVTQINGAGTGVTAAYDPVTEQLTLTSTSGTFNLADVPSAGASTSGNLVEAFDLPATGSSTTDISGKIGQLQNVLQVALTARSTIGVNIQALSDLQTQSAASANSNTSSLSTIEDTNIQEATTQFSLSQTALQAAYLTTAKLESTNLFNYVSTSAP